MGASLAAAMTDRLAHHMDVTGHKMFSRGVQNIAAARKIRRPPPPLKHGAAVTVAGGG